MWACGQVEPEAAGTDAGPGRGTGASRGHSRTPPDRLPAPEPAVRPASVALLTPPSARPGSPASLQVSFWRTCADKIRRGQISKSVPCGMRARTGFLDLPGRGAGGWSVDGT